MNDFFDKKIAELDDFNSFCEFIFFCILEFVDSFLEEKLSSFSFLEKGLKIIGSIFRRTVLQIKNNPFN
jgi:hypothetical protein